MARSYSIRLAAFTLGVHTKWLDNLLSHFPIAGVARVRQGVSREVSHQALIRIEVVRALNDELGIPLARAVEIAESVGDVAVGETVVHALPLEFNLSIPVGAIERRLRDRLLDAIETVAHVRRGRPPSI